MLNVSNINTNASKTTKNQLVQSNNFQNSNSQIPSMKNYFNGTTKKPDEKNKKQKSFRDSFTDLQMQSTAYNNNYFNQQKNVTRINPLANSSNFTSTNSLIQKNESKQLTTPILVDTIQKTQYNDENKSFREPNQRYLNPSNKSKTKTSNISASSNNLKLKDERIIGNVNNTNKLSSSITNVKLQMLNNNSIKNSNEINPVGQKQNNSGKFNFNNEYRETDNINTSRPNTASLYNKDQGKITPIINHHMRDRSDNYNQTSGINNYLNKIGSTNSQVNKTPNYFINKNVTTNNSPMTKYQIENNFTSK